MINQIGLVREFHNKFKVPVLKKPGLVQADRSDLRYRLMADEVEEYKKAVDAGDLLGIAKELADILYTAYGTVLEHGLQDRIAGIFEEVHRSNMSKDFSEYKMVKGKDYFEPDIRKYLV